MIKVSLLEPSLQKCSYLQSFLPSICEPYHLFIYPQERFQQLGCCHSHLQTAAVYDLLLITSCMHRDIFQSNSQRLCPNLLVPLSYGEATLQIRHFTTSWVLFNHHVHNCIIKTLFQCHIERHLTSFPISHLTSSWIYLSRSHNVLVQTSFFYAM